MSNKLHATRNNHNNFLPCVKRVKIRYMCIYIYIYIYITKTKSALQKLLFILEKCCSVLDIRVMQIKHYAPEISLKL